MLHDKADYNSLSEMVTYMKVSHHTKHVNKLTADQLQEVAKVEHLRPNTETICYASSLQTLSDVTCRSVESLLSTSEIFFLLPTRTL